MKNWQDRCEAQAKEAARLLAEEKSTREEQMAQAATLQKRLNDKLREAEAAAEVRIAAYPTEQFPTFL